MSNLLALKSFSGTLLKRLIIRCMFPFRNRFILLNPFMKAKKESVNLNYWNELTNLGDLLSPIIVNYILFKGAGGGKKSLSLIKMERKYRHLYAIGSIITAGIQDCTIWGSGLLNTNKLSRLKGRKLDVRAVRGPLTRVVLVDKGIYVPKVYGDPAIFLPELYFPKKMHKRYKYGIIEHWSKKGASDYGFECTNIDIMTANYKQFVDQILEVEIVVSSSLHGIIIAESYGVPAILLNPKHDLFKYYDWYYSTQRFEFPIVSTVKEAENTTPPDLPKNLDQLRKGLLEAFPYDLF